MACDNRRVIDRIEVEAGDELLVAHAGMLAFVQWGVRKGLFRLVALLGMKEMPSSTAVVEWYKHECLGTEDMPLRLATIVQRDFAVAARVTLHARTATLTLASYARHVAAALQDSIDRIRRKVKRMPIPPVAPVFAPMIFRRA